MTLESLILGWEHEAAIGAASRRADDYADMCRQTVEALRELQHLREAVREIRSADPSPTQIEAWCAWVHRRLSKAACEPAS